MRELPASSSSVRARSSITQNSNKRQRTTTTHGKPCLKCAGKRFSRRRKVGCLRCSTRVNCPHPPLQMTQVSRYKEKKSIVTVVTRITTRNIITIMDKQNNNNDLG